MATDESKGTPLDAPIVAVTVYRDRARVNRQGRATLDAGLHRLVLAPLPQTLEEQSVRASGNGFHARILGAEVITQFHSETPDVDVAALQAELEALQDRERALQDSEELASQRSEFLRLLRDGGAGSFARGLAQGRAELDAVRALAEYVWVEEAAVQGRRRELAPQRRTLAREIQAVQARLAQSGNTLSLSRRAIQVVVQVNAPTELTLDVSYVVGGAIWEPVYDLRLLDRTVEVGYGALIRQHTGEAWPAVELTLSTARPAVSARIPELLPWYLDLPRPSPPAAARAAAAPMPLGAPPPPPAPYPAEPRTFEALPAVGMAAPPPPIAAAEAAIAITGGTVTFQVEQPVAVPPDGTAHRTAITTLHFDAQLDYVSVPKLAAEAYLRARVTNASEATLLPGSAAIFHGDEFVGMTYLDTVAPGEEIELQLGADDRVKVERELVRRGVNRAFIGNVRRNTLAYAIKVTNLLPRQTHVVVYDQLPVARHEEIKVKLDDATPRPAETSDLGILKWDLTLPAGERQELQFSYTVEHPRQHDLPL